MKRTGIVFITLLLMTGACKINRLSNISIPDAYDAKANFTEFTYVAYHLSDSVTRIYYRLNTSGLLYSRNINDANYKARFKIHYELINTAYPKNIADSASAVFTDSLNYQVRNHIIDSMDIPAVFPGNYILNFGITDLNRKNYSITYINIRKSNYISSQNYLLRYQDGAIVFPQEIRQFNNLRIISNNKKPPRLFVRYYSREYPIALPPFVESRDKSFSFRPDSVFFVELASGISEPVSFPGRGIYHFQEDTSVHDGMTLLRFHDDYPNITLSEQMLLPLRYISTKTEFNDMMMMKNTKEAVDQFWLDKSGNPDRAKEMIRRYYNRVVDANRYFTSYHEGWKTDRGMIYIVYGPPNLVYRNPETETWIYGEDRNVLSITFVFNRVENPFTDNDYSLSRTQEYKNTWYTAVDSWRN